MISIGKNIIKLHSIDSTNLYAAELLKKEKPGEGTVIMTAFQEKGRGQRETIWESEPNKNLLASFIFYPSLNVSDHFLFNQFIALAVYEMIQQVLIKNVKIKWPNDIMVGDKKIAGILIENSIRGSSFLYAVSGIGININQTSYKKYSPEATSFLLEKENQFSVDDVLKQLCRSFTKWYQILNDEDFEQIVKSYSDALYRKGEKKHYEVLNEKIKATIVDVNDDGRLLLEKENGDLLKLNFKEVKYII